jgi:hypothetical protein
MMIPGPGPGVVAVIEAVRRTTGPGVTESDVIRWVGVAVGVAGVVLAIPDGMAAAWRWVKRWHGRAWTIARRLLRLPGQTISLRGSAAGSSLGLGGNAYVHVWQQWREEASDDEKVDILHQQVEILRGLTDELRSQLDRTARDLKNDIRDAEGRVTGQLGLLASEMRGERSQASRVDARGFGPIALGIILTGLPDGLAAVTVVGWLFVLVAVVWVGLATPSWFRDYQQALKYDNG